MGLSTQKQYRKVKDKDLPPFTPPISLFSSSTHLLLALFALNWLEETHSMESFAIRYFPSAIRFSRLSFTFSTQFHSHQRSDPEFAHFNKIICQVSRPSTIVLIFSFSSGCLFLEIFPEFLFGLLHDCRPAAHEISF